MAPKPGDGKKRAADEPEEPPAAKKNGGTRAGAGRPKEKLGLGPAKSSGTQPSLAALLGARTAPKEPAPAGAPPPQQRAQARRCDSCRLLYRLPTCNSWEMHGTG